MKAVHVNQLSYSAKIHNTKIYSMNLKGKVPTTNLTLYASEKHAQGKGQPCVLGTNN
jgi:hypothetical protein